MGTDTDAASAAVWVPIDAVHAWKKNPKTGAVEEVAASIKKYGFGQPIVARKENGEVIAGHTRLLAAKRLGLPRVPVRFVDLDEKKSHELALVDQRTAELADWDDDLKDEVLSEADADVGALFAEDKSGGRDPLEVEEVDVSEAMEPTFWMVVSGPLSRQPEAIERLRKALEELSGVTVEMGGDEG